MKFYPAVLIIIAIFAVILTAGCTGTESPYNAESTVIPPESTAVTYDSASPTKSPEETVAVPQSSLPKYTAGIIASDNQGTLKLITVYDEKNEKYTSRTLFKGNQGNDNEAYLKKDGSFKELGISFDNYKSFDSKYPILYDDLKTNPDTDSYYNYDTKTGNRIYIYTESAIYTFIGYLTPDTPESMDFVNTNV